VEEMAQAGARLGKIQPANCRHHAEQNFSAVRMAEGYEQVYTRVLAMSRPREKAA